MLFVWNKKFCVYFFLYVVFLLLNQSFIFTYNSIDCSWFFNSRLFNFYYRRLHIGLCTVTMLISMWISNTAATAMMCPIVEATLVELEVQNIVPRFVKQEGESKDEEFDLSKAVPTRNTMCNYLSIAYSATMGGLGTLVGTGTNLTFKGIYETTFPESDDGVSFLQWMVVGLLKFYYY